NETPATGDTDTDKPGKMGASGEAAETPASGRERLWELAWLFLRLGVTAFGGPVAHIAMMRQEFVQRRHWISDQRFIDLIGIVNLIPGPNSTEIAIYLGYLRAGWPGLIVAGSCFIGPAMVIVMALAWVYVTFGALPQLEWLLYGILPVVIAIIVWALWGLGRTVMRHVAAALWAVALVVLYLLGVNALLLLFGGGVLYALALGLWRFMRERRAASTLLVPLLPGTGGLAATTVASTASATAAPFSLLTLFLTFLKIGAILYGSGYVLLAFLRADFVQGLGWLTDRQLLDAIAVGQFTPGPVFTTATFIGYVLGGWQGALLATLGIFLPSFLFIPIIHRLAGWMRRSPVIALILDGVNIAALALMAGVTLQLAQTALHDILTWALALGALLVLPRLRWNSAWLILLGGIIGLLAHSLP
ncbi:MAG TPA: chromate efflux transporter, partial [Ktedonobacterales bacterium]|nr:chromate efflux transporter [Ktedonobacterales bacterium]